MLDYNNCILSAADVFLQRRDSPILYSLIHLSIVQKSHDQNTVYIIFYVWYPTV